MAIEITLHPLDFEPDIAIGIDLPMVNAVGSGFKLNYTTLDQAYANAKNLLLTNRGERIMQPDFGCNLKNSLFEQLTDDIVENLEEGIRSQFNFWLPYIAINELKITPSIDNHYLKIELTISLKGNELDTKSIQLELTNTQY